LRFIRAFDGKQRAGFLQQYGSELYERLIKASQDRSRKRNDTLFGLKAPKDQLKRALQRVATTHLET
jgi:hypothetical protein